METSVQRRLFWLAALLLVAGLAVGIFPVSSNNIDCGSAYFAASDDTAELINSVRADVGVPLESNDCDGVRSTWRTVSIVLVVGGGVLLAGGWVAAGAGRPRHEDA